MEINCGTRTINPKVKDKWDECILCMDGTIVDDELADLVLRNNRCKKVLFVSDYCHSGSIYDIPPREDIITLGACHYFKTVIRGNGMFSYYFWKFVKDDDNDVTSLKKK